MWNGPNLPLFLSNPATSLFGTPGPPLVLPVRETPEVPWDTSATWVAPQRLGAQAGSEGVTRDDDGRPALGRAPDATDGGTPVHIPIRSLGAPPK